MTSTTNTGINSFGLLDKMDRGSTEYKALLECWKQNHKLIPVTPALGFKKFICDCCGHEYVVNQWMRYDYD